MLCNDMNKSKKNLSRQNDGFTLIEMLCVMILLGILGVVSLRVFTNLVQSYATVRNSDAAVQKAQIALQRMTIDFTYLDIGTTVGRSAQNSITYNVNIASSDNIPITINQANNTILYSFSGSSYILTDGIKENSLCFNYYDAYDASSSNTTTNATKLIGISFSTVGDDTTLGFQSDYSTRVTINKIKEW